MVSPDSDWFPRRTWLCIPDRRGVLGDRTVAGEPARAGHIQDGLAGPTFSVTVELDKLLIGGEIRLQVREMPVIVAAIQQCIAQRREDTGFGAAEIVGEDQIQRGTGLRLVFVMPARVVPGATAGDLLGGQAEQKKALLAPTL